MTIKKGEAWGESGTLGADDVVARSDRDVSRALEDARARNVPFPSFGLLGGDLYKTLGGTGSLSTAFPIDVGEALIDGRHHYFVAHLVARGGTGKLAVAMNAQWLKGWNLGPKAHPNDGLVDAYEMHLGLLDWRKVRRRLPTGSHLPHPGITQTRAKAATFDVSDWTVSVDGDGVGRADHIAVRVLPDAIRVVA